MSGVVRNGCYVAGGVVAGIAIGFFIAGTAYYYHEHRDSRQVREIGDFQFINPLLECEVAEGTIDSAKENFKTDLAEFVAREKSRLGLTELAVYYRDLNNGPAFGVNESARFIPASLLKVPVMMAYFRLADREPGILSREIAFEGVYELDTPSTQRILPLEQIEPGRIYTTEELIHRSVRYSDNQAVALLIEHIPPREIRNLYRIVGVPDEVLNGPDGTLTVKEYAAFFRILFNASYLSREHSEAALALLASTTFSGGIVSGVPPGVPVAHKFGEGGDMNEQQLHDCGIVYYPDHPYLLCVMSRGPDIPTLEGVISDVSQFVFERIEEQYPSGE